MNVKAQGKLKITCELCIISIWRGGGGCHQIGSHGNNNKIRKLWIWKDNDDILLKAD